jgi:hypothetical protein
MHHPFLEAVLNPDRGGPQTLPHTLSREGVADSRAPPESQAFPVLGGSADCHGPSGAHKHDSNHKRGAERRLKNSRTALYSVNTHFAWPSIHCVLPSRARRLPVQFLSHSLRPTMLCRRLWTSRAQRWSNSPTHARPSASSKRGSVR